jgi:hypothetical protein
MGSAVATVTDVQTKLDTANTKYADQLAAQAAAKTATEAADNAVALLSIAGADVIKQVRIKATTAGPTVYELAEIPGPVTPQPVNTLGTPGDFTVDLGADGAPTIKWKCASPRATGTVYQIFRNFDGGTNFEYMGGSGMKQWTDTTIPAGTARVMYKIQAVRSTAAGPWAIFNVFFGTSSSGAMTASVEAAPKAAA